ncbi:MAG: Lipopolysaccharide-assembly [Verrucomicrobia bacterium]|nr:MAG: Lipopolysaccharide-assembly [Verrucomicrobiota bacterium]
MREIRTIAVPAFKNSTLEPRLEVLVANALIRQLQQDGTYRITSERDADAILEGSIERIDRVPSRGSRNNSSLNILADFYQTSEFTLKLALNIKLVEKNSGKTLVEKTVNGTASFFVSGANPRPDETQQVSNDSRVAARGRTANVNRDERQAVPQAAEDAATQITSYLSEGW